MKTITKSFKSKVAEEVASFADKFKLGEVEIGDDSEILRAPIIPMTGGLRPVDLVVAKKNGHLAMQIRNVTHSGSTGNSTNRTVCYLVKHLFCPPRQRDEGLDESQVMIAGLLVDQFLASRRVFDDLLALLAAATNDVLTFSRAIFDSRDGEIYIEVLSESDFDEVPESLEDLIGSAVMHAELFRRCERMMREALVHDPQPSQKWIENIIALTRKKDDSEPDDEKHEKVEKEEEVTI